MSDTFSISVVSANGANLVAQATSANPIVMVDALSCTLAASDAADLATKDASWYNGVSGIIESCSATDNVARIVTRFGNAGANAQVVKSVALRAKLASQSDSDAVIIAAMSDADSEIYLPSNASPTQIVRFPFNIAINANDTVETVYADGATVADLARFVSMYKAGDPTQGESQSIKGNKSFEGDVSVAGVFTESGNAYLDGHVYARSGNIDIYSTNPSLFIYSSIANTGHCTISNSSITMVDSYSQTMITINASGNVTFGGKLTVNGDIKADNVNKIAEFYDVDVENLLNVKGAVGLAPSVSSGVLDVPIGGIVYVWSSELITISNNIEVGDEIVIPANTAYSCKWSGLGGGTTGAYVKGSLYIPYGRYVAIMGSYMADGGTNAPILFMRTEL